ncbi:hypothetical protein ABGB08_23295 [Acrocarpospora sp. B8E8]
MGSGALLYAGVVALMAAVSVFGRTPARRRNAREVLALLLIRSRTSRNWAG